MPGGPVRVVELHGRTALDDLGADLDDLLAAVNAPVTARRPWLTTWVGCFTEYEPWVIALQDADRAAGEGGGRLLAAALLACRHGRLVTEVVGLGHGPSDYQRLPARDGYAEQLADTVASALGRAGRRWRLDLEQLPEDDPVSAALAGRLPRAELGAGDGAPRTRFGEPRTLNSFTSASFRGDTRRKRRKAEAAGLGVTIAFDREAAAIGALLPELESLRRRRDLSMTRIGPLDTPAGARFFREAATTLARRGELEVGTLRMGDNLAAYLVGLVDGASYRSWDSRVDPAYLSYSPGTILELELFDRLLADPTIAEFDRMRGLEDYKMRTTNAVEGTIRLRAWSSPLVRGTDTAIERAKTALRQSDRLRSAWHSLKRRRSAGR